MIIRWGSKRVRRLVSSAEKCQCQDCGSEQPGLIEASYTVRHFCYLLRWVTNKTYYTVCSQCQAVAGRLTPKQIKKSLRKNPIPLYDRLGWVAFLAFIALLMGLAIAGDANDKRNDLAMLSAPRAGDIYEVNTGPSGDVDCRDCRYGTALVSSVDDKAVYVHFSKRIYNEMTSVTEFVDGQLARDPDQYIAETYVIPRQRLADMREKGDLLRVVR